MEINKQSRNHLLQVIVVAILVFCAVQRLDIVIMGAGFILKIVKPFIIGCVIAFILNVPMKQIERNLFVKKEKFKKLRRPLAYIITLLLVIGVLSLVLIVVIPELINTLSKLIEEIPAAFAAVSQWAQGLPSQYPFFAPILEGITIDWKSVSDMAVETVSKIASGMVNSGMGMVSGFVGGVATAVIAFTFSIYILLQKEKLAGQVKQVLYGLLPNKVTEKILYVGKMSNHIFSSFLSGQCLEAVILGTMFVITMTIFGMPYAMLIGIVIAITALVPIVGSFVGCAVGVLLIIMVNPMQAVWFVVLFLTLQQIEGNLIYPHVVGNSVGLPSIWVLAAVTVGGNLFGIGGILFFIPLCSVLYALFREFIKKRLKERKVPKEKYQP